MTWIQNLHFRPASPAPSKGEGIYGTLPRGLKQELHVKSKTYEENDYIKMRKALVDHNTPKELGEIHSFSEIPVPRMIEAWLSSNDANKR